MKRFAFYPELFIYRAAVLKALSEQGFEWFSHYGAIDLIHDLYGLEVCAIHHEEDARQIERALRKMFPDWHYCARYYEDMNHLEIGWKVKITRDIETFPSKN